MSTYPLDPEESLHLLEALDLGVAVLSPEGEFSWANRAAHELLGYEGSELVGRHLDELHEDIVEGVTLRDRLKSGETVRDHRASLRTRDGVPRMLVVSCSPRRAPDGTIVHTRCVLRDGIDALRIRDLEIAAEDRERLLGIIGHDLRNPLMAIHLAASAMMRLDMLDAAGIRLARRIIDASTRMDRMIVQLADYARIRRGSGMTMDPVDADLHAILTRVLDELEIAYPAGRFDVDVTGNTQGRWDPDRLAQALSNVAANAIQHGDGGDVQLKLRGFDGHVKLEISNRGEPIPPESMRVIFDPFRRARTRRSKSHDTSLGLGLFIARDVIVRHGGDIEVRSDGDRTCFSITLPRVAPPSAAASS